MLKKIDKKFGAYSHCCFCNKKYLNENMMEVENQITYNQLSRDLLLDYKINWGFDRSCIRCFNHLLIDNCKDYKMKISLIKKIGEKNGTKDMENGNKS